MLKGQIIKDLKKAIQELGYKEVDIVCSIPENPQFGDYSSNVALQLSNQKMENTKHSPREIASEVLDKLGHPIYLERIEVAGAGFINFFIKDEYLVKNLTEKYSKKKTDKRVLVEYASPNAFKPFHIGHLRNLTTGESIARLLVRRGDEIFKVTYNSDIGLSTAKALWGILKLKEEYNQAKTVSLKEKVEFLGKAYVLGTSEYEANPEVKKEIDEINVQLFQKDKTITELWLETRGWSQAYLDSIFSRLGTEFDAEIWESEVGDEGKRIVKDNIGKVFIEDKGAVIFPGEKYGLHTRVFINSAGNPTYEAKDVGLAFRQLELYPFDEAIHVVGNEQADYFKVVFKAIELIEESLAGKKRHLSYGFVNLTTGKMSSRKGNIVQADDLIDQVKQEIRDQFGKTIVPSEEKITEMVAIGAIKFSLLKFAIASDITFDIKQSISLQGDSGPYLQYTYARTQSVLSNAKGDKKEDSVGKKLVISDTERDVLRQIEYFEGVVEGAASNLAPNELCNYLLNLAKAFNLFYQTHPIIKSKEQVLRLALTKKVGEILKLGLYLLGIEAPDRM